MLSLSLLDSGRPSSISNTLQTPCGLVMTFTLGLDPPHILDELQVSVLQLCSSSCSPLCFHPPPASLGGRTTHLYLTPPTPQTPTNHRAAAAESRLDTPTHLACIQPLGHSGLTSVSRKALR